jgi:D-alanyl-lipoteichoic acid acyltransferase DltB (MBOAT superfamily)
LPHFDIVLPLGISFFTFHHIMYLVDLRRGKAPLYQLDRYALYVSFFPDRWCAGRR